MITAEDARELLSKGGWWEERAPDLMVAAPELACTVIAQAEQLAAIRALYDRRCAQTVDEVSDAEELFLAELREALDGAS